MQTDLSFSLVFTQATNFIRNRFFQIAIISFLLNIIVSLIYKNSIDMQVLMQLIQTADQNGLLSYLSKFGKIIMTVSIIIDAVLIAVIYNYSINNRFNLSTILPRILPNVLNIIGFYLVYLIILTVISLFVGLIFTALGFILTSSIIILLFVALMVLFIIFLTAVRFYFNALITQPATKTFYQKFAECHKVTLSYWRLTLPMVLIYFLVRLVISIFNSIDDNIFLSIICSTLLTILSIFTICFFYRLNMLLTNNQSILEPPTQNNNLII